MVEKIKNDKMRLLLFIIIFLALFLIGRDIYLNMYFFPIDNPGILVAGKDGGAALINQFTQNPRLDFMYNIIIYLCSTLIGNTPTVYFMIQFIFYLITVITVLYFGYLNRTDYKLSVFFASILIWCSSVGENLYTIGKKEIFLTAGFSIFLICLYRIIFLNDKGWKKTLLYYIYILDIFFSLTLKETSNIIICTVLLFQLYTLIFNHGYIKRVFKGMIIVIAMIMMTQMYKIIFIDKSSYTSYQISFNTIIDNITYYFMYHKDLCFIGILSLSVTFIRFLKEKKNAVNAYLLIISITGWGYVAGLCLWRWPQSYYLYPVILFFTISLFGNKNSTFKKNIAMLIFSKFLYVFFFIAIIYGTVYNYCVTKSHVDISIAYSKSVQSICKLTQNHDRIIIDSADLYEEPPYQMKNLLVDYLDKDIEIWGGKQSIWDEKVTDDRLALYGYTREQFDREKNYATPQIGDFIIHYTNNRNYFGPTRAVNPAWTPDTISHLQKNGYILELVDELLISRSLWGENNKKWGIQNTEAGYQIWKAIDIQSKIVGIDTDGWSSDYFLIDNYKWGEKGEIYVSDIGSAINEYTVNFVDIYIDAQFIKTIEVINGTTIFIDELLDFDINDIHEIRFEVRKTFVPSTLQKDNLDNRVLGINIIYNKLK